MRFGCCVGVAGGLVMGASAVGSIQTWEVGGPVTALADPTGLTGGATSWSATITVDSAAPDLEPGDPQTGKYAISLVMTIGTLTEPLVGEMQFVDDASGNDYLQFNVDSGPPAGWSQLDFQVNLIGPPTAFSGDGIPSPLPELAAFGGPGHQAAWIGVTDSSSAFQAAGTVGYLTPSPSGLAAMGVWGVALVRRRRG